MEYPHSNCSTVAAVARQLGKDMQFVILFRDTVNNVRKLSTSPVRRVTTASGKKLSTKIRKKSSLRENHNSNILSRVVSVKVCQISRLIGL